MVPLLHNLSHKNFLAPGNTDLDSIKILSSSRSNSDIQFESFITPGQVISLSSFLASPSISHFITWIVGSSLCSKMLK